MKALLSILLMISQSSFAGPVPCEDRNNSLVPLQWDVLTLREDARYEADQDRDGLNFEAGLTSAREEYNCRFTNPRPRTKCYYEIKIIGTSKDGAELFIPAGTTANVSRVIKNKKQVVIWPNRTEGLLRSHSGNFKIECRKYEAEVSSTGGEIQSNFKTVNCSNREINMLFTNNSLATCQEESSDSIIEAQLNQTQLRSTPSIETAPTADQGPLVPQSTYLEENSNSINE